MLIRYVLFDLDGTLTDPGLGITNCVKYALEKFDIPVSGREELYPYIGPPLTWSFQEYHGLSEEQAQQALLYYRERFSSVGMFENEVYSGIPEMLQKLRDRGVELMIATSKPEEFTLQILEHFDLLKYFSFVAGNTLNEDRPTKESVLRYVLEQNPNVTADNAVMVGDRLFDINGAHAVSLPAVGVLYGYGDLTELSDAKAEFLASDVVQLTEILMNLIKYK